MSASLDPRATGSATRWGPLWGARPADWALSEDQQLPTYEAALERTGLEPGWRVLDIGCGVGAFLRLVAERGGEPHGHRRLRGADRVRAHAAARRRPARRRDGGRSRGTTTRFDLVTGFNSFFFANDMVAALREAGRVAKPGAPVVIQVWGAHERCDLEAMKQIARPFLPPRPPDAPPDPDLSPAGRCSKRSRPRPASRPRASSTRPGLRVPRRGDARPRARRRRRSRHPRRPRTRAGTEDGDRRRPRPLPPRRRELPALERVPLPDRASMSHLRRHPRSGPGLDRRRDLRAAGGDRARRVHERARRRGLRPLRRTRSPEPKTGASACC